MALQLGVGGRVKSLNGMRGASISLGTNLYVAFYFSSNAGGTLNPMSISTTLADLAGYELQVPGTNGYARKRIDDLVGAPASSIDGYHYSTNASDIDCFTTSGALLQTPGSNKQISHALVTTQATSQASTDLNDVWWFGPVTGTPLTTFASGDTLRVLAGTLSLRQS